MIKHYVECAAAHDPYTGQPLWDLECWDVQQPWTAGRPPEVPAGAEKHYGYRDREGQRRTVWVRRIQTSTHRHT